MEENKYTQFRDDIRDSFYKGDLKLSLKLLDEYYDEIKMDENLVNTSDEWFFWQTKSIINKVQGNLLKALCLAKQAKKYAVDIKDVLENLVHMGDCLAALNRIDEAKVYYEKYIEFYKANLPNHPYFQMNYGIMKNNLGYYTKDKKLVEEAIELYNSAQGVNEEYKINKIDEAYDTLFYILLDNDELNDINFNNILHNIHNNDKKQEFKKVFKSYLNKVHQVINF
jgi:tetratricopeptide (TPR) repeat protein